MNALFVSYTPLKGGSAHFRCMLPAQALGVPILIRETNGRFLAGSMPTDVDGLTVVYQQPTQYWHLQEILKLQTAGAKVIVNIDDALWSIRKRRDHGKREVFTKQVVQYMFDSVMMCDGLIVSSEFLGKKLAKYLKDGVPTWVIPNAMDLERYEYEPFEPDGLIRIGFEGGMAHADALSTMLPSVFDVMDENPDVRLVFAGEPYAHLVPAEYLDRVEVLPWVEDFREYPKGLSRIDIGLAPSLENDFCRGKSPLRLYEYGLAGAAVVASGPTYDPRVAGAPPIGLYNYSADGSETAAMLRALVESRTMRERLGLHLGEWVRKYACVDAVAPLWREALDAYAVV